MVQYAHKVAFMFRQLAVVVVPVVVLVDVAVPVPVEDELALLVDEVELPDKVVLAKAALQDVQHAIGIGILFCK